MKLTKSVLITAVSGAAMFLFPVRANAFMNVVPVDIPEKSIVQVMIPENHSADISVYDDKGEVLHFESIQTRNGATRIYDITNLNDGVYTFYSEADFSKTTKKVSITDNAVDVISKVVEYKPVFDVKNGQLLINYLNEDQENVEVMIEGEGRYFGSISDDDMLFHRSIDVSNLMSGEYYAMVKVGMKTYTHKFEIN